MKFSQNLNTKRLLSGWRKKYQVSGTDSPEMYHSLINPGFSRLFLVQQTIFLEINSIVDQWINNFWKTIRNVSKFGIIRENYTGKRYYFDPKIESKNIRVCLEDILYSRPVLAIFYQQWARAKNPDGPSSPRQTERINLKAHRECSDICAVEKARREGRRSGGVGGGWI